LAKDSGIAAADTGHSEKNQEYIMVLEGNLQLTVNNKTYDLHPDDMICFTVSAKHIYTSSGAKELKAVIINFYPVT
jgi:quercetin dioxygenase-like cupin family protein